MEKTTLNVLYQSSDAYAMPTGVSMLSLLENNTDINEINIYLLNDAISEGNLKKIEDTCNRYGRSLSVIDASPIRDQLINYGISSYHGSHAAFYKLFVFQELNVKNGKVLYLDGDTIVDKSIRPLLDHEFKESCIIQAVLDNTSAFYKERVGISPDANYYNTGVLYVDCAAWRDRACFEKILGRISAGQGQYPLADQDLVNIMLGDEIETISETYNFNPGILLYGIDAYYELYDLDKVPYYDKEQIANVLTNGPIVYHCLAGMTGRPWERGNIHPQSSLFDEYYKKSAWCEEEKPERSLPLVFLLQRKLFKSFPKSLYVPIHKAALRRWQMKQCRISGR